MTKKKNRYDSPAPRWLRITRDGWNLLGGALVVYLQAFTIPSHTYNIISATIIFIGSLITGACILWKNAHSDEDIPTDITAPNG